MLRLIVTSAVLAIAAPALAQSAQTTSPAPSDPGTQVPQSAVPDSSTQGAATPQTGADATQATPANAASQVATVVDSEFPAYDADKSGDLNKAEFSKWILALKDQEMKSTGKTLAPTELTAWASAAFTSADADRSKAVSKTELTHYLGG